MPKIKNNTNIQKSLVLGLSLVLIILILLNFVNDLLLNTNSNLEEVCSSFNGTWLEEYKECEGILVEDCNEMNGVFNECESACRHSNSEFCIMMCVPVCSFN